MTDSNDIYLIWSNEHMGWWMHGGFGYTTSLRNAGNFGRARALEICRGAIFSAPHVGHISEIPVRLADLQEFLAGQEIPEAIMGRQ